MRKEQTIINHCPATLTSLVSPNYLNPYREPPLELMKTLQPVDRPPYPGFKYLSTPRIEVGHAVSDLSRTLHRKLPILSIIGTTHNATTASLREYVLTGHLNGQFRGSSSGLTVSATIISIGSCRLLKG